MILDSYDLPLGDLPAFYHRLNAPITFPDGMVTSLGILYWGREEHYASFENAVPPLKVEEIYRFRQLLERIRTPGKMRALAQSTGISPEILRILKHDLGLWLPKPVALQEIELLHKLAAHLDRLVAVGITDQLQLLSAAQTRQMRQSLAQQTGIPLAAVDEIARCSDLYRTGANLKHLRAPIYYAMGLDTWQRWAVATSEEIITRFAEYIRQHHLEARLVPFPKEVRNGIAWAKLHLRLFAVEW